MPMVQLITIVARSKALVLANLTLSAITVTLVLKDSLDSLNVKPVLVTKMDPMITTVEPMELVLVNPTLLEPNVINVLMDSLDSLIV